jgi:F-type H+-transporting ATPase subunit epsilon
MADTKLDVHVVTPEREVWSGEADMLIARTVEGELGILPGHAPLLALLDVGPLAVVNGGNREHAIIDGGFLHVAFDRVEVLAEHAELESEVDVGAARSRVEELERRVAEGDEDARRELARAQARLALAERT